MRGSILALAVVTMAGATAASAQTSTSPTGPAFSQRFFTTALENDPSREVRMQMQLHLPSRPGNGFHTHSGDQWEVVLDGEITFTVRGQQPRVLKAGEYVYIPRGTIHRNENKRRADPHHRAVDHGQGQAAEHAPRSRWSAGVPPAT
jgi:quercetin dioxygenase-like cupin family protein